MSWLQAIVRWIHVFAAILWIGQTYLFNFLERNLEPEVEKKNVFGKLWLVHGGGFYRVEKQRVPEVMPLTLHWFKWEAAATWLSGAVLITLTYYLGGYLIEPDMNYPLAVASGVGVLVIGWVVYDGLLRSPLGKNTIAFSAVCLLLVLGLHFGLTHVLSERAAFIHIGAMFGTIMAANVWMRILPAQRKMIAAAKSGGDPPSAISVMGSQRSLHNSYMVVSLVFIMISNHYPTISYANQYNTFILGGLILLGFGVARLFRGKTAQ